METLLYKLVPYDTIHMVTSKLHKMENKRFAVQVPQYLIFLKPQAHDTQTLSKNPPKQKMKQYVHK